MVWFREPSCVESKMAKDTSIKGIEESKTTYLPLHAEAEKVLKMDPEEFGHWLSITDEAHINKILDLAQAMLGGKNGYPR